MASMTTTTSPQEFKTDTTHAPEDCQACQNAMASAVGIIRATGSVKSTTTDGIHIATVTRVQAPEAPTVDIHGATETVSLTVEDLRTLADALELQGQTVQVVRPDGGSTIGTLTHVYVSDGPAINLVGLIDWAAQGKDCGRDFRFGPLYGETIVPCPDPWIGFKDGKAVKVYRTRALADFDLTRPFAQRTVDSVAPYHQGPR